MKEQAIQFSETDAASLWARMQAYDGPNIDDEQAPAYLRNLINEILSTR